jgi:hypothetical protein
VARVIVTGASSRFYMSLLTLLASVQRRRPGSLGGVVVWDLGLRPRQRTVVRSFPGVELRALPRRARWPYDDWGDPANHQHSYAFKPFAFLRTGWPGDTLLWLDAGIALLRDPTPVFDAIERDGVLLLSNRPHRNREWTSAACAAALRATPDELDAPQISAGILGLRAGGRWQPVFDEWLALSTVRDVFVGSRDDHRHDQTALSILVARHGLPIRDRTELVATVLLDATPDHVFLHHRRQHTVAPLTDSVVLRRLGDRGVRTRRWLGRARRR